MIDIELLRTDPEKIKKGVADKQFDVGVVDEVLYLDDKRRKLMKEVQALQAERNRFAKEKNVEEGKRVKEELKKIEPELEKAEKEFEEKLNLIPNPPLPSVPVGKNETENLEVRKDLGILDFETGAKVAGSQFYFLYGDGALLELALIQYAFELLSKEGFKPVITPDLAKSRYYLGTGYAPKGKEAQTYTINGEDLGLIATAEVTLAGKHADEILTEDQ